MSSSNKRKSSGDQSGLDLDDMLTQLRKLRESVIAKQVSESDPMPADKISVSDQFDNLIAVVELQANGPSTPFSAANDKDLARFNIVQEDVLILRPGATLRDAIIASRTVGSNALWSNDNMYKHLAFLINSFTNRNETSSRTIIDTFFFRSIAMVPPSQKVVVMLENNVPAVQPRQSKTDTISGIVDYTAVVVDPVMARKYIHRPPLLDQKHGGKMVAFFAAEAKAPSAASLTLDDFLPQALLKLVACAKCLGKSHIRGALTTGFKWHFIVVDLNADDDGAKYWVSELIEWKTKRSLTSAERLVEGTSDEFDPALIAGILSSWILESFTEFDGDAGDTWFLPQNEV